LRAQRSNLVDNAPTWVGDCRVALWAPRNDGLLFEPSNFRTGTLVKRPKERWLSVVFLHLPRLAPFLGEESLQADEQIAIEHSERN